MKRNVFLMAVLSTLLVLPATAQEAKKKGDANANNRLVAQFLKQLEPAKLTDEQVAKAKELGKEMNAKMTELRKEAGITAELQKKRTEVIKKMQDSELKGKERMDAINKEVGLTEEQAAAMVKINQMRTEFQTKVVGMLSDEQKAALPEKLTNALKAAGKPAKGKKKKDSE